MLPLPLDELLKVKAKAEAGKVKVAGQLSV